MDSLDFMPIPFPELALVQQEQPRPAQATSENLSQDRGQGLRQGSGSDREGLLGHADLVGRPWCPGNTLCQLEAAEKALGGCSSALL